MDRNSHFADKSSFQLALTMGLVHPPRSEWDPASGTWVIAAQPRQGGAPWVLAHHNRPLCLTSREQARRVAAGLRPEPSQP